MLAWQQMGSPPAFHLAELGPGRGTLMKDLLRSTAAFPDFHSALQTHLVEVRVGLWEGSRLWHVHVAPHAGQTHGESIVGPSRPSLGTPWTEELGSCVLAGHLPILCHYPPGWVTKPVTQLFNHGLSVEGLLRPCNVLPPMSPCSFCHAGSQGLVDACLAIIKPEPTLESPCPEAIAGCASAGTWPPTALSICSNLTCILS